MSCSPCYLRTVFFCVYCLAILTSGPLAAGTERRIDGALHVENDAAPRDGVETVTLEELWRAGGEGDSDVFFGLVTRVVAGEDGTVYLLDPQRHLAHVYDPDGRARPTIFREGDGPGEVGLVRDLCVMPDGMPAAYQLGGRSLVKVSPDGTPGGNVAVEIAEGVSGIWPVSALGGDGFLVLALEEYLSGDKPSSGNRRRLLARYTADGTEVARYLQTPFHYDYENMVFREKEQLLGYMWSYDIGPDGRVYAPPERDRYTISVFNADGTVDRIIDRQFEPVHRAPAGLKRIRQLAERRYRTAPFEVKYEFEDTEPVIAWYHRGLYVDENGRLWVRHARSDRDQPDGVMLTLDVFDAGGHFEKQVAFRCDESAVYNGFFFVGDDRVLLVKGFVDSMRDWFGGGRGRIGDDDDAASGPVEIICYRMRVPAAAAKR